MNRTRHKVKLKGSEKSPLGSNKSKTPSAMGTSCTLWGERGEGWVCHFGLNADLICKTQGEVICLHHGGVFNCVLLDDPRVC